MRQGGATVCFLLPFQTPTLHLGSARCVAQKPNGELERRWSSLRLQSARGSYWCRPVNPQQSPSPRGEGLPGRLQLECILMAYGCPITILFASFSRSTLWRCPFADNRVTACQRTWFPGLLAVCGVCFVLFCLPYRARRPWYFCIWQRVCERQGRVNEAWCVNDRSLGDAAGKLLIWLVWSWKLTGSHWKWLPLGISFILVYLFFPSLSLRFYTQKGVLLLLFLMFLVAGRLDYNLLLNLIAVVSSHAFGST